MFVLNRKFKEKGIYKTTKNKNNKSYIIYTNKDKKKKRLIEEECYIISTNLLNNIKKFQIIVKKKIFWKINYQEVENKVKNNLKKRHDPWQNTNLKNYVFMSPKKKGIFGENYISEIFRKRGFVVENAPKSTLGYDKLISYNNTNQKNKLIKVEMKFSLAYSVKKLIKDNTFIINHISIGKDWHRLIFLGINKNSENILIWFKKIDFKNYINNNPDNNIFLHQQGGKKLNNDDYMCTNICKLLSLSFIKKIHNW